MLSALIAMTLVGSTQTWTLNVGGLTRTAVVVVPPHAKNAPVVFAFHGHGGNSLSAQRSFQIEKSWPEAIVVYLQGVPTVGNTDPKGEKNGWQKRKGESADRDLKFFDALWSKVQSDLQPDAGRIFAMGHSNGGRFTYLLWANRSKIFNAFAPSANQARGLIGDMPPRPAFIVSGREDNVVPYANQKATLSELLRLNSLESTPGNSLGTFHTRYETPHQPPIETYITDGGHTFPSECVPLMTKFFQGLPRRTS